MKRVLTVFLCILCIIVLAACSTSPSFPTAEEIEESLTNAGYNVTRTESILLTDGEKEADHLMADKNSEFLDICFEVDEELSSQIQEYYQTYYPVGEAHENKEQKVVYFATSEQVLQDAGIPS